jgi:hypothetical protein
VRPYDDKEKTMDTTTTPHDRADSTPHATVPVQARMLLAVLECAGEQLSSLRRDNAAAGLHEVLSDTDRRLDEALQALRRGVGDSGVETPERVTYRFWSDGWAVGFRCSRAGQPDYFVYLNPSGESDDGVPNVFLYTGVHGDASGDIPLVFVDGGYKRLSHDHTTQWLCRRLDEAASEVAVALGDPSQEREPVTAAVYRFAEAMKHYVRNPTAIPGVRDSFYGFEHEERYGADPEQL